MEKSYNIVGHNTGRFDSFFILQTICDETCDDPKLFFDGKVPLKISLGSRAQIIDSFRFCAVCFG